MTKDEIINCTDGQALADAVAVEVMGWERYTPLGYQFGLYRVKDGKDFPCAWWQLHRDTDIGKAQCWDLMIEHKLSVDVENGSVMTPGWAGDCHSIHDPDNWQIAVLKAVLLTVKE